jgi:hypothetical protein
MTPLDATRSGRPSVTREQIAARTAALRDRADLWPGSPKGWRAAFRHELLRLLAEGVEFDSAEDQAVANLPAPPRTATPQQELLCR